MTEQNEHVVPDGFTEEDLLLGKKACKYIDILFTSALVACSSIAVFVFVSVPLEHLPLRSRQVRRLLPDADRAVHSLALHTLHGAEVWPEKEAHDHHTRKGSRIGLYILGTSMILLCVWTQWILAVGGQIIEDGFTAKWRWEK